MSRRAPGEGHVRKRSDGLWEARLSVPGLRSPKSFYGNTQKEAIAKRNEYRARTGGGVAFDASALTFGEYLYHWLNGSVRDTVRERTYERAEQNIRVHLLPSLGPVKLDKLTGAHLQALYRMRMDEGLKPRTVLRIHQTANKALSQAVKWRLIHHNPAEDVTKPKAEDEEINPLTREQVTVLIKTANLEDARDVAVVVDVLSGLRAGELFGLRWKDVDFERGVLRVRQALIHPRSGLKIGPPKNESSKRAVDIPDQALEALKKRKVHQASQKLSAGREWPSTPLVFNRLDGTPVDPSDATRRVLKPLLKRASIPWEGVRFHDLRHTYATLQLINGTHPKIVQQALGHSTIAETMNRYSHVLPSLGRDAARQLGELF